MEQIKFKIHNDIRLKLEDAQTRSIQILIRNEEMLLGFSTQTEADWKIDLGILEWKEPCFVLFKVESFLLLHYLPMGTPVKEKMMYSIAKQFLLKEFQITNSLLGGEKNDFSAELVKDCFKVNRVYTVQEVEKQQIIKQQSEMAIGLSTRGNSASIAFPIEENLRIRLENYQNGDLVVIGLENEKFKLVFDTNCPLREIPQNLKCNEPMFFVHRQTELLFGYISPPSAPIKTRMLYAASKANLVSFVETVLGSVDKKVDFIN
jgi:hypothetical protein